VPVTRRRLPALLGGAVLLLASCGGRPAYSVIEVGDAPFYVSKCGFVLTYALAPLVTSVGGQVALHAAAHNSDGGVPNATLGWVSPRGRIAAVAAPDTAFTCVVGGRQAVSLAASTKGCTDLLTFSVTCIPPLCGNGRLDVGEQCDPPDGGACLEGCALPCGNGLLDGSEQCDPPDGVTCSAACRKLR
jgi:hypothetical protein